MKLKYPYTHLEDFIFNLYANIDVFHWRQLSPELIGQRLGITVDYLPMNSLHEEDTIILDSRLTDTEQWQEFGHELCHVILHAGNQLKTPPLFKEYKEWKANSFAEHLCVPTFMLNNLMLPDTEAKAIWMIQEKFGVERGFAQKRLHQYLNNQRLHYKAD